MQIKIDRSVPFETFSAMAFHSDGSNFPAMPSAEVQRRFTGQSGDDLLANTVRYVTLFRDTAAKYGRPLTGADVMDFGCGFGRFLRMMYYFTDPSRIWAVDSSPEAIEMCRSAGLNANFINSPASPNGSLSPGDWKCDVGFSVSIFTHLAKPAADACLAAIRHHMRPGGIFMLTIRPVEYWAYRDGLRGSAIAPQMEADHARGYAYIPHEGKLGETYGDASMPIAFFRRPGWEMLESTPSSFHQVLVTLRAV